MKPLLIFLATVVFFVISLSVWNAFQRKKGITAMPDDAHDASVDGECCGKHAFCKKPNLTNSISGQAEYFDDEALDVYSGTPPGQYPEEAVEQFKEVLHSMYDKDKLDWLRSLRQRGIAFPDQLKDEMLQTMNNLRLTKQKNDGLV